MAIQAFGYLGVGADNLDDWTEFATRTVGMQAVDRGAAGRAFRMDDRQQRLFVDPRAGEGERVFGWEVAGCRGAGRAGGKAGRRWRGGAAGASGAGRPALRVAG